MKRRSAASGAGLAAALVVLGSAAPALAHGDMAAVAIGQLFGAAIGVVFAVIAIGLGFLAVRLQWRPPATTGAVFGRGIVGVGAIMALTIAAAGGAMSYERTPPLFGWAFVLVPALLAAQLFVSARFYRILGAPALRVGSVVLAVVFILVGAFAALALVVDATTPDSQKVSGEVRRYERGCDAGDASDCNMLGLRLQYGDGTPKDLVRAANAFDTACAAHFDVACTNRRQLH